MKLYTAYRVKIKGSEGSDEGKFASKPEIFDKSYCRLANELREDGIDPVDIENIISMVKKVRVQKE